MGELLLKKALAIRARIGKLRAALPASPSAVRQDERLEAFLSFQLFGTASPTPTGSSIQSE